jgi:hypothetical protein
LRTLLLEAEDLLHSDYSHSITSLPFRALYVDGCCVNTTVAGIILVLPRSITNRLSVLVSDGKLFREVSADGTTFYYSPSLHRAESDVAHIVSDLMRTSCHTFVPETAWLPTLPGVIRHVLSTVKPGAVLEVADDDALATEMLSPEQVGSLCPLHASLSPLLFAARL